VKIAFLNIYNGVVDRGSEVFVKEMAARLSQKHSICIFQTGKKEKEKFKIQQISGIPFTPFSSIYNFWALIFSLKCLPYLWGEKFDWIIPINGRCQVIICRFLRFLRGGKILISGHAGAGFEDKFNLLFGKPDIFVALSPAAFSWAKKVSSKRKILYIPNGVDEKRFNPQILSKKLSLPRPIIICVSALLAYKRIDRLIKAASLLSRKASLLIIGDGPLKKELTVLGQKLLDDRFLLLQSVPYDEIGSYYNAADIFSLPSRESEAFGLVYLEAMACNLPIVAPNDINRRQIIGSAGLFCDVENIKDYTQILEQALDKDFNDIPRKQAEKFTWEKMASQYEKALQTV
jgi:glycosyltransferase involved in cell wall biosynthesis